MWKYIYIYKNHLVAYKHRLLQQENQGFIIHSNRRSLPFKMESGVICCLDVFLYYCSKYCFGLHLVAFLGVGEAGDREGGLGQRSLLFCSGRGLSCVMKENNPAQSHLNAAHEDSTYETSSHVSVLHHFALFSSGSSGRPPRLWFPWSVVWGPGGGAGGGGRKHDLISGSVPDGEGWCGGQILRLPISANSRRDVTTGERALCF